jgi:DNA phosphorothioation-dependent restriction protein DptG
MCSISSQVRSGLYLQRHSASNSRPSSVLSFLQISSKDNLISLQHPTSSRLPEELSTPHHPHFSDIAERTLNDLSKEEDYLQVK